MEGQVALVTGAASGIGRAVSLALAASGARVVVFGRTERRLGEVVGEIAYGGGKARHVVGDVRDPALLDEAVRRACDDFGRLDVCVACAGVAEETPILPGAAGSPPAHAVLDAARAVLETNLLGTYLTFRAAAARIADGGRLVAVSDLRAHTGAAIGYSMYCATKAGILGLVRAAAAELAPRGVRVNAVCPGPCDTALGARLAGGREGDAPLLDPMRVAERVVSMCGIRGDASGAVVMLPSEPAPRTGS